MNCLKLAISLITLCLIQTGDACVAPDCDRLDCGTCGKQQKIIKTFSLDFIFDYFI